jgi:hypothetical protein
MVRDSINYSLCVLRGKQDAQLAKKLDKIHAKRVEIKCKNERSKCDYIHRISRYFMYINNLRSENKFNIVKESILSNNDSFLAIVYLNDGIAGYLYGLCDQKAVRIMQNCFDEQYKFYSPLFRGVYDVIAHEADSDVKEFALIDFTRGGEEYKYKLGGQEITLNYFVI